MVESGKRKRREIHYTFNRVPSNTSLVLPDHAGIVIITLHVKGALHVLYNIPESVVAYGDADTVNSVEVCSFIVS